MYFAPKEGRWFALDLDNKQGGTQLQEMSSKVLSEEEAARARARAGEFQIQLKFSREPRAPASPAPPSTSCADLQPWRPPTPAAGAAALLPAAARSTRS